jgi:hypothetical protein
MKKSKSIFRKCVISLTLIVSVIVYLPEVAFGKGAVIGYACGDQIEPPLTPQKLVSYPSNAQLDRLTHVMTVDLYPDANGYLLTNQLPTWNPNYPNNPDAWIVNFVGSAHQSPRNVKVSICISADSNGYFSSAISTHLTTFITNIVNFVNAHELDGVDFNNIIFG